MNRQQTQQQPAFPGPRAGLGAGPCAGREGFPPRILKLLQEVADRTTTATRAPWQDSDGEPLQDEAEAALAWIANRTKG